jgi:hypothetical protein
VEATRGERTRETLIHKVLRRETPKRSEGPGEPRIPLRTNPLESDKGNRFFRGVKPLERRYQAGEV